MRKYSDKELCDEFKIRLAEVNSIAKYLNPKLNRILKDATMGCGRSFGKKRVHPLESQLNPWGKI